MSPDIKRIYLATVDPQALIDSKWFYLQSYKEYVIYGPHLRAAVIVQVTNKSLRARFSGAHYNPGNKGI